MSTTLIAYLAMVVFTLMVIGLFLTAKEFLNASNDPSQIVGEKRDIRKPSGGD
jgi:hypothetical protein